MGKKTLLSIALLVVAILVGVLFNNSKNEILTLLGKQTGQENITENTKKAIDNSDFNWSPIFLLVIFLIIVTLGVLNRLGIIKFQ